MHQPMTHETHLHTALVCTAHKGAIPPGYARVPAPQPPSPSSYLGSSPTHAKPFFSRYRAQMQFWCRGWRPDRVGRAERGRQESDLGARFRLEVATALAYIPCSHTLGRSGHGVQASTLDPKLPRPLNDLKPILTVVDAYWDSGEALPRPVPGDSPTRYPAVLVAPLTVWS